MWMWLFAYIWFFRIFFAVTSLLNIFGFFIGNIIFGREKNWERDLKWIFTVGLIGSFIITVVLMAGHIGQIGQVDAPMVPPRYLIDQL